MAASTHDVVTIGVRVDATVQGQRLRNLDPMIAAQGAFDEVAHQAAHDGVIGGAREVGMSEEVQLRLPPCSPTRASQQRARSGYRFHSRRDALVSRSGPSATAVENVRESIFARCVGNIREIHSLAFFNEKQALIDIKTVLAAGS